MRKTATPQKTALALFLTGCVAFLAGAGNLAFALSNIDSAHSSSQQETPTVPGSTDAQEQTGSLNTEEIPEDENEAISSQESTERSKDGTSEESGSSDEEKSGLEKPNKQKDKKAKAQKAQDQESKKESGSGKTKKTGNKRNTGSKRETAGKKLSSSKTDKDSSSEAMSPATVTIHHTASKRIAVYRKVHHTAAISHTVTTAKGTKVSWTLCRACGKRHGSSFTEKVVDHYRSTRCAACGGIHAAAYDEIVTD